MLDRAFRLVVLALFSCCALAESSPPLHVGAGERLLVFAPHPDDEVLGAGGIAQRVLAQGGSVRIVIATAGDGFVEAVQREARYARPSVHDYLRYGATRLTEARQAARALGNGRVQLDLLGFPDGGLQPLLHAHWQRERPERSLTTGVSAVPYGEAEFPNHAYNGAELSAELTHALRQIRPTLVALPDPLDSHPDHSALGLFALMALHDWLHGRNQGQVQHTPHWPRLLTYLVHWPGNWPTGANAAKPLDLRTTPLRLPDDWPRRGHERPCLSLQPREVEVKRTALAQYQTQQRAMGPFLAAFVRSTECVSVLTGKDAEFIWEGLQRQRAVLSQYVGNASGASASR